MVARGSITAIVIALSVAILGAIPVRVRTVTPGGAPWGHVLFAAYTLSQPTSAFRGVTGADGASDEFDAPAGILEVVAICGYSYLGCKTTIKDFQIGAMPVTLIIPVRAAGSDEYGVIVGAETRSVQLVSPEGDPAQVDEVILRDADAHHFHVVRFSADGKGDLPDWGPGAVLIVESGGAVSDIALPSCGAVRNRGVKCGPVKLIVPRPPPPGEVPGP